MLVTQMLLISHVSLSPTPAHPAGLWSVLGHTVPHKMDAFLGAGKDAALRSPRFLRTSSEGTPVPMSNWWEHPG